MAEQHPDKGSRRGRPSTLTDDVRDAIAELVEKGLAAPVAAASLGIGERTYFDWMARGKVYEEADDVPESEEPYLAFFAAVTRACAEFEAATLEQVRPPTRRWRLVPAAHAEMSRPSNYNGTHGESPASSPNDSPPQPATSPK